MDASAYPGQSETLPRHPSPCLVGRASSWPVSSVCGEMRREGWLRRRGSLEVRAIWTWIWLLPAVGVVLALVDVALSAEPAHAHLLSLRTMLEVGMPLGGLLLGAPLLEREWTQGTIAQVALRTPLGVLLAVRVLLALGYITCLTAAAAGVGMVLSPLPHTPETASGWQWVGSALLATLAPTVVLMALALLVTHATVSSIPGYVAGFCAWLGSFVAAQVLPQSAPVRDFLLFGWSYPPFPDHIGWMVGKAVQLLGALLLFAPQVVLLRAEARLIRNSAE